MTTPNLFVCFLLFFLILFYSGEANTSRACNNEKCTFSFYLTQEGKIEICVSGYLKSKDFPKLIIDGVDTALNSKYRFNASSIEGCLYITIYITNITEQDYGDKEIKLIVSEERSFYAKVPLTAGEAKTERLKFGLNGAAFKNDASATVDVSSKVTLKCRFNNNRQTGELTIRQGNAVLRRENNSIEYVIDNVNCVNMDSYTCDDGKQSTRIRLFVNMCEWKQCPECNNTSVPCTTSPGGNGTWKFSVVGCASSENFPMMIIDTNYVFPTTRNSKYIFDFEKTEDVPVKSIITLRILNVKEEDYGNKRVEIHFSPYERLTVFLLLQRNADLISTSAPTNIPNIAEVVGTEKTTKKNKVHATKEDNSRTLVVVVAAPLSFGVCIGVCIIIVVVCFKRRRDNKKTKASLDYGHLNINVLSEDGCVVATLADADQRVIHPLLGNSSKKVPDSTTWGQASSEGNSGQITGTKMFIAEV
ncbi:uncharacterized protein LOC131957250 [Physella acuta]|uniref:uncharacterized protein LOC131957250 n=1 Tax=Physella acuta TaxID=109671 RepID=UPI0027DE5ABD|nr:uncharacterized protein LOC131957250 [Physella acuta]